VNPPRRPYAIDLTDAERQLLVPLISAAEPGAARPSMTAASWSTPWPTGCRPAAPGSCCPRPAAPADRAWIWRAAITVTEPIGAVLVRLALRKFVK